MEAINLESKFSSFNEYFSPQLIAELNGQKVFLVKSNGSYHWHSHENEDEMFLIVKGELTMHFRGSDVAVREGEIILVPRGVEHCPEAKTDEVHLMLFEPAATNLKGD